MFLFKCCQQYNSGQGYQLQSRKTNGSSKFVNSLKSLSPEQLYNDDFNIIKIKKSEFEQVLEDLTSNKRKYIDHQFPPNEISLGEIEGIQKTQWKRIQQIIPNPTLFGSTIEPSQVIQGNLGDCYFLSALAALSQNPVRIKNIFGDQIFNTAGIYKVPLMINGEINQIIVDDYVPVNEVGQTLFCQPNKNQFWVLILQKAWAKVHKSYSNIIMGTPAQVLRGLTFSPAQMLQIKKKNDEKQKLWSKLQQYTRQNFPICCTANENINNTKLSSGHTYTLLSTALLEDVQGVHHKLMKLRDPWGKSYWDGFGSDRDKNFWEKKIVATAEKKQFQRVNQNNNFGVFYITFNDFCQYFSQIHFCSMLQHSNFISQPIIFDKKHGKIIQLRILKKGTYSFGLHQSQIDSLKEQDKKQQGLCRSTILLIRNNQKGNFDFIDGVLKLNEENTILSSILDEGNYLIFVKLDPTRSRRLMPTKSYLSVYSPFFINFEIVQRIKYPYLLRDTFLKHARNHKKNSYNNGYMWISSKLFFHQGGYAYVAFGNEIGSNKKFIINLEQEQFTKMSFKLKGQFKNAGTKKIEILPGQQRIFLARVKNQLVESLKFPPAIGIKMEMIQP